MSAIRLNAAAVAANRLPVGMPAMDVYDLLAGLETRPIVISRRDVIKAAGVAATVATGALSSRSLEQLTAPEAGASARVAWLRAGASRAVLDPARFAGAASLTAAQNGDWSAVLSGARFPGTSIPAGMSLSVGGTGIHSRIRIEHELGGFQAEVGLADWLTGARAATSTIDLVPMSVQLGDGLTLELGGRARGTLSPDWSMRIEAPGVAQVRGLGERIIADTVTIALAAEDSVSLLSRRIARRALITLEAGADSWSVPSPPEGVRGAVDLAECAFRALTVEAAETRAGSTYSAAVAFAGTGAATFVPRGRAAARGATPLSLTDVRYARLLDGSGTFHLAAALPSTPTWVKQAGRALLIGAKQWTPPFEMWGSATTVKVSAHPALLAVSVPFEGGIASPITLPAESRTTLNMGDRVRGFAPANSFDISGGSSFGTALDLALDIDPIPIDIASTVEVVRPDDMLVLRFEFYNLSLVTSDGGGKRFVQDNPTKGSYVAVRFPAQHILEKAILDPSQVSSQLNPPLPSYLSGDSCLSFSVSGSRLASGIEYSMDGLLDWTGYTHNVVPAAENGTSTPIDMTQSMIAPSAGQIIGEHAPHTYIELPWGIYLSPYSSEWWKHRSTAFASGGRTELWHTQLHGYRYVPVPGVSSTLADALGGTSRLAAAGGPYELDPTVRAIWARRYQAHLDASPSEASSPSTGMFRNPFTRGTDTAGFKNRWNIVDLSARFHGDPIKIKNLMLTSMGGWIDSVGEWDIKELKYDYGFPIPGSLTAWEHRATMGRDQYVKIVTLGYLFPFGHEAVELTVTERRVDSSTKLAFLGMKKFIVVVEPVKTYAQENDILKRRHPFSRVEIKTKRTPALKVDSEKISGLANADNAYIVRTDTPDARFLWQVEATDWDDVVHKFEMPLIWVIESTALKGTSPPSPSASFTLGKCAAAMRGISASMSGQKIAFAKPFGSGDSARVMSTNWMKFSAEVVDPVTLGGIWFHPIMYQANVVLDAIAELTNQNAGATIQIADIYRDQAFGGTNATGKVFAKLVSTSTVPFPPQLSGAVATPIPRITGISATKGAFGGDETQFGGGKFNPADILDSVNAELFGGITLVDIIKVAAGGLDLGKMPVFEKVPDPLDAKTIVLRYTWTVPVENKVLIFVPLNGCTLTLTAEVRKGLEAGAGDPTYEVVGTLGPFRLDLVPPAFDALHLSFGLFTFTSINGAAPTVNPDITNVEFGNDLKYLAKLAEYLGALSGASSTSALATRDARSLAAATIDAGPLKIDVSGTGVKASLTIAIPDLAIGVFSLKNMSFYAALNIPFTGDVVTLDFAFCTRESPFELLVMGFGGGGYVLMTFDPAGMRALEISLEFGAGTSFGIGGIASGSVEIKGGMIIRYERRSDGEYLDFTVFIRIHGELDILGIIAVTLTFYLELKYRTFPKQSLPGMGDELTGTATLTIEIEILFFTIPIELSVTKTLAGEDPRFGDLMPAQDDWDEYCEAFALSQLGA